MSSHGGRSKGRHPNPTTFAREAFQVGHITFEIAENPKVGSATYALIAGMAPDAKHRKPLFTGHCAPEMGQQLRDLAKRFDEIKDKK